MLVFVLSYIMLHLLLYYLLSYIMFHLLCYYLLEAYSLSNERQKRSGSGQEGREGGTGKSRGRENCNQTTLFDI